MPFLLPTAMLRPTMIKGLPLLSPLEVEASSAAPLFPPFYTLHNARND